MAIATFEMQSDCLRRPVTFRILIPGDAPAFVKQGNPHYAPDSPKKLLVLLHGYTGYREDWLLNSRIREFSDQYNLTVVMPSGENSFYLDGPETGRKYGTFVGRELVDYVRKTFGLSTRREDTFIGGLSMGGFGALHVGLRFSETFGKIVALSSALIVYDVCRMKAGEENPIANYEYYHLMFGDLESLPTSQNNPETLVDALLAEGKALPAIYQAVGTEDFLYENNQIFRRFLESRKVPLSYHEGPGSHNFEFWNAHLQPAILWLLGEEKSSK